MSRAGLAVALAIAAIAGLVLGLFPQLDLAVSRLFYTGPEFPIGLNPVLRALRDISMLVVYVLAAPAVIAPLVKLIWPQRPLLIRGRAIVFLISTLLLAPGLAANVILKGSYGRERPIDIVEFGGTQNFTVWWDWTGACRGNCSFIAGEASGAFWTIAPAALAPPAWRPYAYAAALTFGSLVGLLRMSFGGHFLSDVIFAGVITFLIIWLVYGALYRWSRTRLSDAAVERALERFALALRRPFRAPQRRLANRHAKTPEPGG